MIQNCIWSETHNWYMYTMWEIETVNLWFTQMPSQGEMGGRKIFACLGTYRPFVDHLWSVSHYIMGPLSGWWRLGGIDQQCLAAPIWKYRSGIGDHRFTFLLICFQITHFTQIWQLLSIWVVADRDVAHPITLNFGTVEKIMQNRLMPV